MITTEEQKYLKQRTWAEINLENLKNNYDYLRSLAPDSKFMGMVKADAYGHGATDISLELEKLGCDILAVAYLMEGISLRKAGLKLPILILGDTSHEYFQDLLDYDLIQTVYQTEQAIQLREFCQKNQVQLKIHLKVETGMGRLGFLPSETEFLSELVSWKEFEVEGIFTHLAQSETEKGSTYTLEQYLKFDDFIKNLEQGDISIPMKHMANSGGILHHAFSHRDMIRAGIALYGYDPNGVENENLKPILSLYTRVISIRDLDAGTMISYGGSHELKNDCKVAVLAVGYGDGIPRSFSNGMTVSLHDTLCPIIGRVCMDLCMIDISQVNKTVSVGDIVEIYGKQSQLEVGAKRDNTISYELLCNISARVPRIPLPLA